MINFVCADSPMPQVTVKIDFVRPPEGEYESRECATITLPGQKT